jgi:hypothetical protein
VVFPVISPPFSPTLSLSLSIQQQQPLHFTSFSRDEPVSRTSKSEFGCCQTFPLFLLLLLLCPTREQHLNFLLLCLSAGLGEEKKV